MAPRTPVFTSRASGRHTGALLLCAIGCKNKVLKVLYFHLSSSGRASSGVPWPAT